MRAKLRIAAMDLEECCGCSACASACTSQCIVMQEDEEGFLYPRINAENCTSCNLCKKVCPINQERAIQPDYPVKAYACINKNEAERLQSSSGGVFCVLARYVLERGGKVYGAAFDKEWAVCHIKIDTVEEIGKLQGSKYLQSNKNAIYKQVKEDLQAGREVLFSGTPCEIGGLKGFLGRKYEKLLCVDVVCHGVPSPMVWQKYLAYIEEQTGCPRDRESTPAHRSKSDGWSRYSVSIPFSHDTEYRKEHDKDLYMRTFLENIILRPSCYNCHFKPSAGLSDISLADFWGIENVLPEFFDDKGTSLILVNTGYGNTIFREIQDSLRWQQVDYDMAVKYNQAIYKSPPMPAIRKYFFAKLKEMDIRKLMLKVSRDSVRVKCKHSLYMLAVKTKLYRFWKLRNRKTLTIRR